jgi:hypothetical protein
MLEIKQNGSQRKPRELAQTYAKIGKTSNTKPLFPINPGGIRTIKLSICKYISLKFTKASQEKHWSFFACKK